VKSGKIPSSPPVSSVPPESVINSVRADMERLRARLVSYKLGTSLQEIQSAWETGFTQNSLASARKALQLYDAMRDYVLTQGSSTDPDPLPTKKLVISTRFIYFNTVRRIQDQNLWMGIPAN
jgi:hypothetical protein